MALAPSGLDLLSFGYAAAIAFPLLKLLAVRTKGRCPINSGAVLI